MDTLFITDLRVATRVGVYDWERLVEQTVAIDLEIAMPDARPCTSDDFADVLDYAAVAARVKTLLADHPYHLVERLAEAIADLVLQEFRAPWVRVTLAKIAPIPGVRQVGVRLERGLRPVPGG